MRGNGVLAGIPDGRLPGTVANPEMVANLTSRRVAHPIKEDRDRYIATVEMSALTAERLIIRKHALGGRT